MINFAVNEPDTFVRYNREYLASIIMIENIIRKFKPSSEFNYSFNFIENGTMPPSIEINHVRDSNFTFDEIIESKTNKQLADIFKEFDYKSHNINDITKAVKTRLLENLMDKGFKGRTFNLEQALDALTPFSQENKATYNFVLENEHKMLVLLMAIYNNSIHLEVVQDVLILLEKEVFSV